MTKHIRPDMIEYIARYWEDRRKASEVQELVEAIVSELKQKCREAQRRGRRDDVAFFESLIADAGDQMFWEKMDLLLHFSFDY